MARSNTDNSNQQSSQQGNCEDSQTSKIPTHFVEEKPPDQFQLNIIAQIPVVDAAAIQVHLESHLV